MVRFVVRRHKKGPYLLKYVKVTEKARDFRRWVYSAKDTKGRACLFTISIHFYSVIYIGGGRMYVLHKVRS